MRQLTTTELNTISGGNDALVAGLIVGGIIGLTALSYPYYGYPSYYSAPVVTYVPPVPMTTQSQVVTPGSYNGVPGVWVDTYTTTVW